MKNYQLGLYEKAMPNTLSWEDRLNMAKVAQYDFVEMSIDATEEKIQRLDMSPEERLDLLAMTRKIGVPIQSMCVSALTKYALGDPDEAIADRGLQIALKSIKMAEDLGVRVVMIPGYDIYYGESTLETKHKFLQRVRVIAEAAEAAGVMVGFETMENAFMNTVEKAMKYVTLTGSCYLKVYPDLGNITNAAVLYQHDVLEDLELGRGQLCAMHLKETKPGIFREVPYGEGHVDFEKGVQKAWELGVRRFVTEFWYTGSSAWREDIMEVSLRFRTLMDQQTKSMMEMN